MSDSICQRIVLESPVRCLNELFEEQVQRSPDAVALEFEDQQLSYQQLNAHANQLAHYLRSLGGGPEVLVGVCLERSIEMIVGLLGILKAGAAYLPLDPTYPDERLAFLIQDSRTPLILTSAALKERPPLQSAHTLCLDALPQLQEQSKENPGILSHPRHLAYVIYTSGSTGRPKGVLIEQGELSHYLQWCVGAYEMWQGTGALVHSSLAFDLTVTGLWGPLLVGQRVVLVAEDPQGQALISALKTHRDLTLVKITPAHLQWLGEQIGNSGLEGRVRTVVVGGEALVGESLERWRREAPETRVVNEYGPTETVVGCCVYACAAGDLGGGPVPIGQPIVNTQLYVLDGGKQSVPVGMAGELYIGGGGVGRGYLNRPDLTAERFVPDHFSQKPGARLYRTGDLVRLLPDGNLEFAGRVDHQVKLRGYRIELGEVESVLRQHPDIRDAVVVLCDDPSGQKCLVGYLVACSEKDLQDLRDFLRARLPDYMVPSIFVRLDALPLTHNGKVDRQALPYPQGTRVGVSSALVEPRTPTEQWLVNAWQEQLGIHPIGIQDNFFEIGGHSLMAARIFALLQKDRGRNLSPATLFQAPTIAELAAIVDQQDWKPAWKCLVAVRPNGTRPPFFSLHGAMANVLYCKSLARYMAPEIPVYGIQSLGLNGQDEPLTRIEEMAEYYLREIQSIQPQGPYYLGGISGGGLIALEIAQRLRAQGQEVGMLALMDTECPVCSPFCPGRSRLFERKLIPWVLQAEQVVLKVRNQGLGPFLRQSVMGRRRAPNGLTTESVESSESNPAQEVLPRIFRLNRAAAAAYTPRPYPGRITLFHAAVRHPLQYAATDTRLAWSGLAEGGFEVQLVPGNHASMRHEPHVQVLAEKLTACLLRAYDHDLRLISH